MRRDKPSRTAYKVAATIITLDTVPEFRAVMPPGIAGATARLLVESGAVSARLVRWSQSPRMMRVYMAFDWMIPGQFAAFAYRKAFCERQVRAALHAAATQVLVLGAGYDTIGWRLGPEFPGVRFFEIDHPATARLKAKGIAAMGTRDNLHLIAEDLGQRDLADVLQGTPEWDPNAGTAIVAEGLLMYLPPEAVSALFRKCAGCTGRGSRIAFSYIPAGPDGRLDAGKHTKLMLWMQRKIGEPWLWSVIPDALPGFLAEYGWALDSDATRKHGVEAFCAASREV